MTISIKTDFGSLPIKFDPRKYKTCAAAAKALHKTLSAVCRDMGMDPEIELFIQTPEESAAAGCGRGWRVCWEAGPYEWAVSASWQTHNLPHWHTEPYYSFDLCFFN